MGLKIRQTLCPVGVDVYSTCEWDTRTVEIKEASGKEVFRQEGCELPAHFSELSGQIVVGKYFRGAVGGPERETSLRQVIDRVVHRIAGWGFEGGYFADAESGEAFIADLKYAMLHQFGCFNSPVLFNLGVPDCEQQASACFILEAEDTMEGWMRTVFEEAMIFKRGSGSGLNLSPIRSSWESLSGGGMASGPISLMKILDTNAGQIKSGGRVRRAAKMHVLDVGHPDILETREGTPGFVGCKLDQEKAAHALIDAGYNGGFNVPGGAYERVFFQNANHSVRAPDAFFQAVEADGLWSTKDRFGNIVHTWKAREIHERISAAAWSCGDPAYQYQDTIAAWHTLPNTGEIVASNPCSEFLHLNNTSCNLYSLRLTKFLKPNGYFDALAFEHVCRLFTIAGEIIVDGAEYPTVEIGEETRRCRPLGLGYCDLGALLMRKGLAYDSREGREMAAAITSLMSAVGYRTSAEIARACGGPFEYFKANRREMFGVLRRHAEKACLLEDRTYVGVAHGIAARASLAWEEALTRGGLFGFRNSQISVIAPTGTISFWLGADTTGIEPDISLVKSKSLSGGGVLNYANESVERGLDALGYDPPSQYDILCYVAQTGHLEGCRGLKAEHLPVFDCAFTAPGATRSIHYLGHLRMMAAVQPFVSGALSKTVNLPNDATIEEVGNVYLEGWRMGLKCVAVYRDGSKRSQPLAAGGGAGSAGMDCPSCGIPAEKSASEKCFVCPNCGMQSGCSV